VCQRAHEVCTVSVWLRACACACVHAWMCVPVRACAARVRVHACACACACEYASACLCVCASVRLRVCVSVLQRVCSSEYLHVNELANCVLCVVSRRVRVSELCCRGVVSCAGATQTCTVMDSAVLGICKQGTRTCSALGVWDPCRPGARQDEICGDGIDQDCDGSDVACAVCANGVCFADCRLPWRLHCE
jgi:hypothetical protein